MEQSQNMRVIVLDKPQNLTTQKQTKDGSPIPKNSPSEKSKDMWISPQKPLLFVHKKNIKKNHKNTFHKEKNFQVPE